MSSRPIVSFPDETLDQVLATLTGQDVGRVVVVEREDRGRILGIITKGDVLRAYNEEAVRASPGALPSRRIDGNPSGWYTKRCARGYPGGQAGARSSAG